jgi:hypothetical protein
MSGIFRLDFVAANRENAGISFHLYRLRTAADSNVLTIGWVKLTAKTADMPPSPMDSKSPAFRSSTIVYSSACDFFIFCSVRDL